MVEHPAIAHTAPVNDAPLISRADAYRFWLWLGCVSFGGPAGQIAIMHRELVERRKWIGEGRFLHALNYTMVLPGPEAQQLATYLGWLFHGTRGGIIAGTLFVLPSLLLLMMLSFIYLRYRDVAGIAAALYGIKPAVVAIVAFAAFRIGTRVLKRRALAGLSFAAFLAIFAFDVPFPLIIAGAAVIGVVGGRVWPAIFSSAPHASSGAVVDGRALIDDDTPLPAHAEFRLRRTIATVSVCLGIGVGAFAGIVMIAGVDSTPAAMAAFFTQAAFVTFGGAYAVLPYVYQGAVEQYSWLTAAQMIDGLALGETTPGPLIMVVAFVGFVGGWGAEIAGPGLSAWSGVAGACIATLFTFLPSFAFILAGAPAIEATRGDLRLGAPLTVITAAVVGVIVNLALFFAYHVLWPAGFDGAFEWPSLVIGVLAALALRLGVGIITVIVGAAACGFGLGIFFGN